MQSSGKTAVLGLVLLACMVGACASDAASEPSPTTITSVYIRNGRTLVDPKGTVTMSNGDVTTVGNSLTTTSVYARFGAKSTTVTEYEGVTTVPIQWRPGLLLLEIGAS